MAARRRAARWPPAFRGLRGVRARPEGALQQLQRFDDGRNALGAGVLEDGLRRPRCRSTSTHWGGGRRSGEARGRAEHQPCDPRGAGERQARRPCFRRRQACTHLNSTWAYRAYRRPYWGRFRQGCLSVTDCDSDACLCLARRGLLPLPRNFSRSTWGDKSHSAKGPGSQSQGVPGGFLVHFSEFREGARGPEGGAKGSCGTPGTL